MNYRISETLKPGEITSIRGIFYKAEERKGHEPCYSKCHALIADRCLGLCYRFLNGSEIVLKKIFPPDDDTTLIETEFASSSREYNEKRLAALIEKAEEKEQTE